MFVRAWLGWAYNTIVFIGQKNPVNEGTDEYGQRDRANPEQNAAEAG